MSDAAVINLVKSVGVSGTRDSMPVVQEHAFYHELIQQIRAGATEVHHGGCTGTDAFAHYHMFKMPNIWLHVHPMIHNAGNAKYDARPMLARSVRRVDHDELPSAERNEIIASQDVLISAPAYPESDPRSKRSGTWQTIRKAKVNNKLVILVHADGEREVYHQPQEG